MTGTEQAQSLTAEVNWSADSNAVLWVGSAPVHQYWPLLAPHFSSSFLPPQRRMEGDAVAWTWRSTDSDQPAGAKLAALRGQLERDLQQFVASQDGSVPTESSSRPSKNRENLALLLALLKSFVAELLAKSDAELAKFVAQTESGLRLHSWGAKAAAPALSPEQLGREISGTVIHGGRGTEGVEVMLESSDGSFKTQTRSDESGHFRFSNLRRGGYRLLGQHPRLQFPAQGMAIAVEGEALSGLKLRAASTAAASEAESADESAQPRQRQRQRRRWPFYAAGGLLAACGIAWFAASRAKPQSKHPPASLTPEAEAKAGLPARPLLAAKSTQESSRTTLRALAANPSRKSASPSGTADASSGPRPPDASPRSSPPAAGSTAAADAPVPGGDQRKIPSAGQTGTADQAKISSATAKASPASTAAPAAPSSASARKQPKGPPQNESPANDSAEQDQRSAPPKAADPAAAGSENAAAAAPAPASGWKHHTELTLTDWRTRLLIDPILPTAPSGDASLAALEAMRQRLLAEQRAKIPRPFLQPRGRRRVPD